MFNRILANVVIRDIRSSDLRSKLMVCLRHLGRSFGLDGNGLSVVCIEFKIIICIAIFYWVHTF